MRPTTFAAAIGVSLLIAPKILGQTIVSATVASPPTTQRTTGATAEMERVIVTGSNIPTASEVGPNPVDTYRPADLEKLGVRNSTDLLTNLPQEMGTTSSQTNLGAAMARHTKPARFAAERNSGSHRWKTRRHSWEWRMGVVAVAPAPWRGHQSHSFPDD
jgi:hypothetical protein